jgi:surface protein
MHKRVKALAIAGILTINNVMPTLVSCAEEMRNNFINEEVNLKNNNIEEANENIREAVVVSEDEIEVIAESEKVIVGDKLEHWEYDVDDDKKIVTLTAFKNEFITSENTILEIPSKLTTLDKQITYTVKITNLKDLFNTISKLQKVDISEIKFTCIDKNKITLNNLDYSNLFNQFVSLKKLDLQGLDTSKITNMSNLFFGCSELEELNLSGLNTSSVTNMSGMFLECLNLKTLNLNGLDTSNVTDMTSMFAYCSSLNELNIDNLNTSNVRNVANIFFECSNLTK